jgi:MraZ protein
MLRGNYTARLDTKGRLKVPSAYRRAIEERWGRELYVTSLTGDSARLFPMSEWIAIEEKLQLLPSMDPAKKRFLDRTNYYGQVGELDQQGRVVIHPLLRSAAQLLPETDVAVLGYLTYLEVWSLDRFRARLEAEPFTEDDAAALARLGI